MNLILKLNIKDTFQTKTFSFLLAVLGVSLIFIYVDVAAATAAAAAAAFCCVVSYLSYVSYSVAVLPPKYPADGMRLMTVKQIELE